MLTDAEVSLPLASHDQEDMSRSQSPLIPLTIEDTILDIKTELHDSHDDTEEEDILNSSLTAMDWLPKLNAKAGVIEEEVPEEEKKPPHSYASLIRMAIVNAPVQKATLADIYGWIQDQFLYYKTQTNPGWKNSIRHNLSLNKCFMKVARSRQDPGKGCYWAINHLYQQEKLGAVEKKNKSYMCPTQLFNTSPLTNVMQDLHNNYLLQQSQQQLLLGHLSQLQATQQSVLPALLPLYQQQNAQLHPTLSPLMDNWASSSEADLSKSLSQCSDNQVTKIEPQIMWTYLTSLIPGQV